jgi:hypothetical protein
LSEPFLKTPHWKWILVIATIAIVAGGALWGYSERGLSVSKLERLLQSDLPADADRAQIEAWFDRRGIVHHYSFDTTVPRIDRRTMPELSGMIWGAIEQPRANVSLLFNGRIEVFIFLDRQGRRAGHQLQPFAYMP